MKALILAAGYATRLYPLTKDRAKALLPIGDRKLLDYIYAQIEKIDRVDEVIVVSNAPFYQQFKAWADEKNAAGGRPVRVLDDGTSQDSTKLGAVGDLNFAIKEAGLDDDLLVMAGDNLFTYRLADVADAFYQKDCAAMILGQKVSPDEDIHRFAVAEIDENGKVLSLEEKPENPRSDIVVFATYFYRREVLPMVETYLQQGGNPDAPGNFPAWLYKHKTVTLYRFEGECYDIGTPHAYEAMQKLLKDCPQYMDAFAGAGMPEGCKG